MPDYIHYAPYGPETSCGFRIKSDLSNVTDVYSATTCPDCLAVYIPKVTV